ncbi:hypothetical protein BC830DRAFT_1175666 [Chytriomyces sp. MP71]|nr:hypothetical protein BC830DRAFT_1175666 [Chytriomyces sp. MP71]
MSCTAAQQSVLGQVSSTWGLLSGCVHACFNSVGVMNPPTCPQVYNSCNGVGNSVKFESCVTACPAGFLPASLIISTVRTSCKSFPPVVPSSSPSPSPNVPSPSSSTLSRS